MTEKKADLENNQEEASQVANLNQTRVEIVDAEMVRLHQSAAQNIRAEEVALTLAGAIDVKAAEVVSHESALGLVSANDVEMTNSAAGAIRAENVNLVGQVGALAGNTVNLGNTYAGLVAGREVRGERIETLILVGNKVEGDVQTVIDTRGALIAGMIGGLFAGLIVLVGRLLFGRNS